MNLLDAAPISHGRGRTPLAVRALRSLAAALIVGCGLLPVSSIAPGPVSAVGPLPECRLANIMTVPRDYDSWSTTLVDWLLRVPKKYEPPDLVPVSEAGIAGAGLIRAVAIDDLRALAEAAAQNGTPIAVNSPYRSYAEQVASFNGWVAVDGYDDAITYSQRPGHSEHQLGLTIDFMTLGGGSALQGDWATTPSGAWMAENAWKYGWLMSYPKGAGGALFSDATCFHYEPWHYRYVGRRIAARIHRSGLTIREYLWRHYTMVDPTTGEPLPTPTPTPSPSPTPSPTASPTREPSATPEPTATQAADPGSESQAGRWFGVDPPVVVTGVLIGLALVLVPIGIFARRGLRRR
ncbi:MAG TPA: M15 family metallopeptidase [Candidatus Limnocylindria bacterium]|nr:M15 family metallopeptidase [Candidatus Limnocylindria bacterium]